MKIVAGCMAEEASSVNGSLSVPCENKKSPDRVVLNLKIGEGDSVGSLPSIVEYITVKGIYRGSIPGSCKAEVFNSLTLEEYKKLEGYSSVYPLLVYLPDGFCDMLYLKRECEKNSFVRFTGGNLLAVEGVRIGRTDKGKEKLSPVFSGVYDYFMETELSELSNIVEKVRKNRKKLEGAEEKEKVKKSKSSKKVNQSGKKKSFARLFGEESEDF